MEHEEDDQIDLSGSIDHSRDLPNPSATTSIHDCLWLAVIQRPLDFEPYGCRVRNGSDCNCGCKHYYVLAGEMRFDWGVCMKPKSHRCGLLTFEHQGCPHFEYGPDPSGIFPPS
jgi:hypothetical protein